MARLTHRAWKTSAALCIAIATLPGAQAAGEVHPLSRPAHPYRGKSPRQYVEGLLDSYRQAQEELVRARAEIRFRGGDARAYGQAGMSGAFGIAFDKEARQDVGRLGRLRQEIIPGLEAERAALEREWNDYCTTHLRMWVSLPQFDALDPDVADYYLRVLDGRVWDTGSQELVDYRDAPGAPRPPADAPQSLAWVQDAAGAAIVRADPGAVPGGRTPGTRTMQHSGAWKEDLVSWKEYPCPNKPETVGPFSIAPGKYRARIEFDPACAPGMTASNVNTGMSVRFAPAALPERSAAQAASVAVTMDGKTSEGSAEFTIKRPGRIWVTFTPARRTGHAGGAQCPGQSYRGHVELLEAISEETAFKGADLRPGDRIRAGSQRVTVRVGYGAVLTLEPGAEVEIGYAEGGPGHRIDLQRGRVRLSAPRDEGQRQTAHRRIECAVKGRVIKPLGTDFTLSDAGVEVLSGAVEVSGAGETVTVPAGEALTFRDGRRAALDAHAVAPSVAADGVPTDIDFWAPSMEPFGEKAGAFAQDAVGGGWTMADPPARRGAPIEVRTPGPGVLRLTVPPPTDLRGGRDGVDTAPRLLHKATGDLDLEAELQVEGEAAAATVYFAVRAPGAYPGILHAHPPDTAAQSPFRSYWLPAIAYSFHLEGGAGLMRTPALNLGQTLWPRETPQAPLRVRLSRRDDLWVSSWSRDGIVWQAGSLDVADLPDTCWVGWAFATDPYSRGRGACTYTLRDVSLRTAPLSTLDRGWAASVRHGGAEARDSRVRLTLDGTGPGAARAFSPDWAEGDFEVTIDVHAPAPEPLAGDRLRVWSVSVVTPREQAVGFISRADGRGVSYGLLRDQSDGYRAPTPEHTIADRHIGTAFDERPIGLRLTRRDGLVSADFRAEGEWKPARPDHPGRRLEGPVLLRLEAFNGEQNKVFAPMEVEFSVQEARGLPPEAEDEPR